MTLQRRLVAILALMLVIGLVVADLVTYASVRSFLYGRADATLSQDEALTFNYLNFEASRGLPVNKDNLSHRVSTDVYVILLNSDHQVIMRRPSGPDSSPDPSPILTKDIPVQHVPFVGNRGVGSGRYAGTFRPDPDAVVLGSTDDPDGQYRAIAVSVPQGTLITSLSLNPTNDTLSSLRRIELIASLLGARGPVRAQCRVRPARPASPARDGRDGRHHRLGGPEPSRAPGPDGDQGRGWPARGGPEQDADPD